MQSNARLWLLILKRDISMAKKTFRRKKAMTPTRHHLNSALYWKFDALSPRISVFLRRRKSAFGHKNGLIQGASNCAPNNIVVFCVHKLDYNKIGFLAEQAIWFARMGEIKR